jgi:hypothetical protein
MLTFKQFLNESILTVYHGTSTNFTKFDLNQHTQKIIWFTSDLEGLKNRDKGAQGHGFILTLKVNIKNPAGWDEYDKYGLDELEQKGYDGVILNDKDGTFDGFVFKNKQVKIISSEKVA